jgi:predicted HTH transcriptional regulator
MKTHYIHKLIAQGEHQKLDFKFEIANPGKIAKTFSAFANSNGGRLLIGVNDDGSITGIRTEEERYMAETAVNLYCKPSVIYETREWQVAGKKILEILIEEGDQKPYLAKDADGKWIAYIRLHDRNIVANRILVKAWIRKGKPEGTYINYGSNEKLLLQFLEMNEFITLSKLQRITSLSSRSAENILINFLALEILEAVVTEKQVLYRLSVKFRDINK